MTLGLYDSDRRYRRRIRTGLIKGLLFVGLLVGTGLFAYQMGIEQLKGRDAGLREEISQLARQKSELQLLVSQLQHTARTAEARAAEMEARYKQDVPTGELAKLSQLISERLGAGLSPARLAFVITTAQNQRNCQQPESKRFVLPTAIYKASNRSVTFANGTVTVTGEGQPARDTSGNPEGWFDPNQPVTLKFVMIGGKESVATGHLPLHHSVVIDNTEHRFTINAGQRSFVEVTGDRCSYP